MYTMCNRDLQQLGRLVSIFSTRKFHGDFHNRCVSKNKNLCLQCLLAFFRASLFVI